MRSSCAFLRVDGLEHLVDDRENVVPVTDKGQQPRERLLNGISTDNLPRFLDVRRYYLGRIVSPIRVSKRVYCPRRPRGLHLIDRALSRRYPGSHRVSRISTRTLTSRGFVSKRSNCRLALERARLYDAYVMLDILLSVLCLFAPAAIRHPLYSCDVTTERRCIYIFKKNKNKI